MSQHRCRHACTHAHGTRMVLWYCGRTKMKEKEGPYDFCNRHLVTSPAPLSSTSRYQSSPVVPAHHRHFPDTMRLANFCCGDECCQVVPQPRHQRQRPASTEILLGLAGKDLMRMTPSRVHQRARTRTHTLSPSVTDTHKTRRRRHQNMQKFVCICIPSHTNTPCG